MATFMLSKVLSISNKKQKKFFFWHFEASKNPQNSKIFNRNLYQAHSKKKITKICKNGANHTFFLFTLYVDRSKSA